VPVKTHYIFFVTDTWTQKLRRLNPNVSKAKGDRKARLSALVAELTNP